MLSLYWIFRASMRKTMGRRFRRLQVGSAGFMAFAHGSNDAQKTMGIITLALFSAGVIPDVTVPTWVIVVSATALSAGTAVGGWRIMKTMGQRVAKLEPVHGFAAETTAASILFTTAHFGMPVSTTQVIASAIMGVGASQGARAVRWGVARRILVRVDPDHPRSRHPRRARVGRAQRPRSAVTTPRSLPSGTAKTHPEGTP